MLKLKKKTISSPNAFNTIIDIVLKGSVNVTLEAGKMAIAAQKVGEKNSRILGSFLNSSHVQCWQ